MTKEANTSHSTSTNMAAPVGSAPARSHNGMEVNVSISQVQGVPVIVSEHAATVAARINALNKDKFSSAADWGFAVLCHPARNVLDVQRAYRTFMRCLHPDKAGTHPAVVSAVEALREATNMCEKVLRQQEVPARPTKLKFDCVCS